MQESLLFLSDFLAVGCLMALASGRIKSNMVWSRILRSRLFVVVPLLSVGMYATLARYPSFYLAFGETVALISISATIWRVIRHGGRAQLLAVCVRAAVSQPLRPTQSSIDGRST